MCKISAYYFSLLLLLCCTFTRVQAQDTIPITLKIKLGIEASGPVIHYFNKNILDLIDILPNQPDKKAFVFSTSGQGKIEYNKSIEQKLKEKDFKVIGSFACKGYDTFGPFKLIGGISKARPNNSDIQKAKEFAAKL